MPDVKQVQATLIGDVLGSRRSADRAGLHEALAEVVAAGNAALSPVSPLRVTVGDEFQGSFRTVGAALHAALWLRLRLVPVADLRHGIGWGRVEVLADEPRVEDGPGWWAARTAIEEVKEAAERAATRTVRTAYRRAEEEGAQGGPDPRVVNAALLCRDEVLGSVDGRSAARTLRLLRGSLDGLGQHELAAQEGISASAVSQRFRRDGLGAVLAAEELMRGI